MKYIILLMVMTMTIEKIYSSELQTFGSNGVLIINQEAYLYDKPDKNSIQVTNLYFLFRVSIINITNIRVNDQNEQWFYIDSGILSSNITLPTLKGWVKRNDIAGRNDFLLVNKIQEMIIDEAGFENSDIYYYIKPNGTFQIFTKNKYFNVDKIMLKGSIYQLSNILLFGNMPLTDQAGTFYFDENGKIHATSSEAECITDKLKINNIIKAFTLNKPITYIVTGDKVNVRTEQNIDSLTLIQISKGMKVVLLNQYNIEVTIGDKTGHWVYIDTGIKDKSTGETIKGWVFDAYLKEEGK